MISNRCDTPSGIPDCHASVYHVRYSTCDEHYCPLRHGRYCTQLLCKHSFMLIHYPCNCKLLNDYLLIISFQIKCIIIYFKVNILVVGFLTTFSFYWKSFLGRYSKVLVPKNLINLHFQTLLMNVQALLRKLLYDGRFSQQLIFSQV